MISLTPYSVSDSILEQAQNSIPYIESDDKKSALILNQPTGNFFYDPWKIKPEFKDTVWETILNSIPAPIGEARIIQLQHGTCYMSHCDIDDRYHLNLEGQYSFLIDVDSQEMFPTTSDAKWYTINTGLRHVAANFGSVRRSQLVVRFLLNKVNLSNPVGVKIMPTCVNPRFEFDDIVSPWLNKMNKLMSLSDFKILEDGVSFKIEEHSISDLDLFPKDKFKIVVEK